MTDTRIDSIKRHLIPITYLRSILAGTSGVSSSLLVPRSVREQRHSHEFVSTSFTGAARIFRPSGRPLLAHVTRFSAPTYGIDGTPHGLSIDGRSGFNPRLSANAPKSVATTSQS